MCLDCLYSCFINKITWKEALLLLGAAITFGMSIWSFVTASQAFAALSSTKSDYAVTVNHWESKPVIDIQLVLANESCPTDYEVGIVADNDKKEDLTIGEWPGSDNWCECKDGGFDWTYTYTQFICSGCSDSCSDWGCGGCSSEAEENGCTTDSRTAVATDTYTTEKGSCSTNATLAGCVTDSGLNAVELQSWRNHKICYKRGGWNTIQRYKHIDGHRCKHGFLCQSKQSGQDHSTTICAPSSDKCPIVYVGNISDILTANPNLSNPNFTKLINNSKNGEYRPLIEFKTTIGLPCWKGRFGKDGRSNNERVVRKFDSECDKDDTRFTGWDFYNEVSLLNENNVPTSGGNIIGDGNKTKIQYYNTSSDVNWQISYRQEIFWADDCKAGTVINLSKNLHPVRKITGYQSALLILNGIFGLGILGIVLPLITVRHVADKNRDLFCISGSGDKEKKNLNMLKITLTVISKICKFVPLIACLMVTEGIYRFFQQAANRKCSDSLTNNTMKKMAEEINIVRETNQRMLIIDCVLLVVSIIQIICEVCCSKDKKDEEEEKEKAKDEKSTTNQVQVIANSTSSIKQQVLQQQVPQQPIPNTPYNLPQHEQILPQQPYYGNQGQQLMKNQYYPNAPQQPYYGQPGQYQQPQQRQMQYNYGNVDASQYTY